MKPSDIVKHISKELPKYTTRFTTQVPILSITTDNGIATATISSTAGLTTGSEISITGAKTSISITSITRQGNIVTVTTASNHYLPYTDNTPNSVKDKYKNFITIQGAVPNEYNGAWEVYTSFTETEFTFKIKTTPTTPATTNGLLLLNDYENVNGYKTVTVINATTFTFPLLTNIDFQVTGAIFLNITRVASSLSQINFERSYTSDINGISQNWLYVMLGGGNYSNQNGIPTSDITATKYTGQDYEMVYQKTIEVYAILPYDKDNKNILQGDLADEIHNVITPAMQKTLARTSFSSPFKQRNYEGLTLESDTLIEGLSDGSYSIYQWLFKTQIRITNDDVYSYTAEAPLREIYQSGIEIKNYF